MMTRSTGFSSVAVLAGSVLCGVSWAAADNPTWVARLVRHVPVSQQELATAFEASKDASVQVAAGDPLELPELTQETEYAVSVRSAGQPQKRQLTFDYGRRGVLTFGSELLPDDEAQLPLISRQRILRRVRGDYVSLQLRVHRDRTTGAIYLYHKPFAAVGSYGQPGVAQEFAAVVEDSVRNVRGLGLFVPEGRTAIEADDLRTWVAVNRSILVASAAGNRDAGPRAVAQVAPDDPPALADEEVGALAAQSGLPLRTSYEAIFVRARVEGEHVQLHAFVTTARGTRLDYLPAYQEPSGFDDCTLRSAIVFTGYTAAKRSPTGKASRAIRVHSRTSLPLVELDRYAAAQHWEGGALANLTAVLDAVIDRRIPWPPPGA